MDSLKIHGSLTDAGDNPASVSSMTVLNVYPHATIENVEIGENFVHITKRARCQWVYCNGVRPPDSVWRERYIVVGDKLFRQDDQHAKVTPASTVPEKVEF